jgi:hypothetical protein
MIRRTAPCDHRQQGLLQNNFEIHPSITDDGTARSKRIPSFKSTIFEGEFFLIEKLFALAVPFLTVKWDQSSDSPPSSTVTGLVTLQSRDIYRVYPGMRRTDRRCRRTDRWRHDLRVATRFTLSLPPPASSYDFSRRGERPRPPRGIQQLQRR